MPRAFSAASTSPMRCDDHRRQALGRLVEQQHPDAGAQDAGDRQHLLLAAGELGARAGAALLRGWGTARRSRRRSCRPRRRPAAASGSPRPSGVAKMPRSSGTKPMPAWAVRCSGRRIRSWPSKRMVPVRLRTMPMMARSVVVLPTPLRPSRVTVSPRATSRSTPCSDVALAVPGVQAAHFEQRASGIGRSPYRPRARCGSLADGVVVALRR